MHSTCHNDILVQGLFISQSAPSCNSGAILPLFFAFSDHQAYSTVAVSYINYGNGSGILAST